MLSSDRDPSPVLGMLFLIDDDENIGGYYALVLIFLLSYWLLQKRGEWHFLKAGF